MSWVCSICGTNNEDGAEICFVCDTKKSEMPTPSPKKSVRPADEPRRQSASASSGSSSSSESYSSSGSSSSSGSYSSSGSSSSSESSSFGRSSSSSYMPSRSSAPSRIWTKITDWFERANSVVQSKIWWFLIGCFVFDLLLHIIVKNGAADWITGFVWGVYLFFACFSIAKDQCDKGRELYVGIALGVAGIVIAFLPAFVTVFYNMDVLIGLALLWKMARKRADKKVQIITGVAFLLVIILSVIFFFV